MSKIYELEPTSDTLHGFFSKDLEPALTIESGDTVHFRTLDSGWGLEKRKAKGKQRKKFTDIKTDRQMKKFGHALVGPIYINGAQRGQTLEIKINEILPGSWGWTSGGGFPSYWNKKLGFDQEKEVYLDFNLDVEKMVASSQFGDFDYNVAIRPFMGIMGMPPNEEGQHSTFVPRETGGNIDCKELQVGSTLYLPISVTGGLFSTGDGHGWGSSWSCVRVSDGAGEFNISCQE